VLGGAGWRRADSSLDARDEDKTRKNEMTSECVAELAGVTKRYGAVVALDGLDLEVRRGELLAVLGPNGAGKTTAIALLLGLAPPDAGRAVLFGQPPGRLAARRALPFCAAGLAIGALVRGQAGVALTNLVYTPMMWLSGLFFPLPGFLRAVAPMWPAYHVQQLAFAALGGPSRWPPIVHLAVLAAVTAALVAFAVRRLARVG
jgi:ABC transporter